MTTHQDKYAIWILFTFFGNYLTLTCCFLKLLMQLIPKLSECVL